jgi:hypothetical protein
VDKAQRRLQRPAVAAGRLTVQLASLSLSAEPFFGEPAAAPRRRSRSVALSDAPCVFCGVRSGKWQATCCPDDNPPAVSPACPLCALARRLDRPRIDAEAVLIWLPQMSQQAVNTIMREIHTQLRALGEMLGDDDVLRLRTPGRHALCSARAELTARAAGAASRLGTDAPSELGSALCRLSPSVYARRSALLGGLRVLPRGRLFEADRDVYPEIVDTWIELAKAAPVQHRPQA